MFFLKSPHPQSLSQREREEEIANFRFRLLFSPGEKRAGDEGLLIELDVYLKTFKYHILL
jgi:hypothetical protein